LSLLKPRGSLLRISDVENADVRFLFRYWRANCVGDLMPRERFDPIPLGRLLPNIVFLKVNAATGDLIIRVAGEEIESRYGRSLRDTSVFATFPLVRRGDTSQQWTEMLQRPVPKYRIGPMAFPNGRVFKAERIMLPMSDGGADLAYVLGAVFYSSLRETEYRAEAVAADLEDL